MDRPEHEDRERVWLENRRWITACLLAHMPRGPRALDLEDLLQEVALRVMQKIDDLKDPASLKPWLRRIAINTAMEAGRRSVRRSAEKLEADVLDHRAERDTELADSRSELAHVLRLVRKLPSEQAEPLLLKSLRGLSQREIAELCETTEEAIESRLARARKKLRDLTIRRSTAMSPPPSR